jgi:hypothetical protein
MMLTHRIKVTIEKDRKLTLEDLPFHSGEVVEVMISSQAQAISEQNEYPLRGTALQYLNPTEPVAEDDWEVI